MAKWQQNPKTTVRKVTPPGKVSRDNRESIENATGEELIQQIGQMLTQCSCIAQYATSLELVVQSNLATPVMVEALLFALSVMVNHTTITLDRLKTSMLTLKRWHPTTLSREEAISDVDQLTAFIEEIEAQFLV